LETPATDTLALHDALPIYVPEQRRDPGGVRGPLPRPAGLAARPAHRGQPRVGELRPPRHRVPVGVGAARGQGGALVARAARTGQDRKSTRLNSSHVKISYA